MSRFSNQLIYCNACGKEQHKTIPGMGKDWQVCSIECLREMQIRYYNGLLGKEYEPWSKKIDDKGNIVLNEPRENKDNS
jgi:hypothetical protein